MIQRAGKGDTIVIWSRCSYVCRIKDILTDNNIFAKLDIPAGKIFKYGFHNLYNITTKELFFTFNDKCYTS